MIKNKFKAEATVEGSHKWDNCIKREADLYGKTSEIRTQFERDYTRILHSTAYRRLKHKTQVFFATTNDHVCTRIEHVNHVNSVSKTIANFLGLNTELTDAISIGHDLGHAPFGHEGEVTLKNIIKSTDDNATFWHEKNSLRFVDSIETLEGPQGKHYNLNLTYAVRDGIICHCGEVNENGLTPRQDNTDLNNIPKASGVAPYTWEGCVVKVSDKIAYLGRDIEDAITLDLLNPSQLQEIDDILRGRGISESLKLNNTVLIHRFIIDLCEHSNPTAGIALSESCFNLMKEIKEYCEVNIYKHRKIERYKKFVGHILTGLYDILLEIAEDIANSNNAMRKYCPSLFNDFKEYLEKHSVQFNDDGKYSDIRKLYDLTNIKDRREACVDFIAGMTDHYAIKKFKETITF